MISCFLMGGLGNQLFQIFTTISLAMSKGDNFVFINLEILTDGSINTTVRHTYWKNILVNLVPFLSNSYGYNMLIKERSFEYNEFDIISNSNDKILLKGYFQSYKYFQSNYITIYNLLNFDKQKEMILKKLQINTEYLNNTISIHFRIGDYKKITDYHPIMDYNYYEKSLNYMKSKITSSNTNIIYFCEQEDISDVNKIINKLKQNFTTFNFILGNKNLEDWEQMLFMSCCHHNIIANSSFSWWAAYLNFWSNKIVCYPSKWFGDIVGHNTKDLCPSDWIKIQID
jgi:hypothetical protein